VGVDVFVVVVVVARVEGVDGPCVTFAWPWGVWVTGPCAFAAYTDTDVTHSTRMIAVAVKDTFLIRNLPSSRRRKARTARRVLEPVFNWCGSFGATSTGCRIVTSWWLRRPGRATAWHSKFNPVIREIVGVSGQVKTRPDAPPNELEIYVPYAQNPWGFATLVVQAVSAPASLVPAVTAAIGRIDKAVSVTRVRTMDEVEAESTARPRFRAQLVGAFAGAAVVLAAIGIFSVLMFNVHLRRREFSIRVALGATGADIIRVVVVEGAYLAVIGVAIGLGAATWLSRSIRSLLFGVEPIDLTSYGFVTALLTGIALMSSVAPALRAAKSDPAVALRES
jgi:hypothetical protein